MCSTLFGASVSEPSGACAPRMAALDISRVVALTNKAQRLMDEQRHFGHAAAKFGEAVEVARTLGPAAGEDCLVVAMIHQVESLSLHADFTPSLPASYQMRKTRGVLPALHCFLQRSACCCDARRQARCWAGLAVRTRWHGKLRF